MLTGLLHSLQAVIFIFFLVLSRRVHTCESNTDLHLTSIHLWKWKCAQFPNLLEMGIKFQRLKYYSGIRKTLPVNNGYVYFCDWWASL